MNPTTSYININPFASFYNKLSWYYSGGSAENTTIAYQTAILNSIEPTIGTAAPIDTNNPNWYFRYGSGNSTYLHAALTFAFSERVPRVYSIDIYAAQHSYNFCGFKAICQDVAPTRTQWESAPLSTMPWVTITNNGLWQRATLMVNASNVSQVHIYAYSYGDHTHFVMSKINVYGYMYKDIGLKCYNNSQIIKIGAVSSDMPQYVNSKIFIRNTDGITYGIPFRSLAHPDASAIEINSTGQIFALPKL